MNGANLTQHQCARFSAAAPGYDLAAKVQRAVGHRLFDGLAHLGNASRALDIGCGTGALTRELARMWPRALVVGIDHAPGMIAEARRQTGGAARPVFECADATRYTPPVPFDLLFSSSTLHWLQPFRPAMRTLARLLETGGSFAFALMLRGTLHELHAVRSEVAPAKSPAAAMPEEAEVDEALRAAGFAVTMSEIAEHHAHAESARELIHQLHKLGVTGGPFSRADRPLTRGELARVYELYDHRFRDDAGARATYRVGYYWGIRRD